MQGPGVWTSGRKHERREKVAGLCEFQDRSGYERGRDPHCLGVERGWVPVCAIQHPVKGRTERQHVDVRVVCINVESIDLCPLVGLVGHAEIDVSDQVHRLIEQRFVQLPRHKVTQGWGSGSA